ncbi:MAG: hypothetical protein WD993_10055 [Thermoleophilaceae bacterium]
MAHDDIACDDCGRTLLAGEQVAVLEEPGRQRRVVCELCTRVARRRAWERGDEPRPLASLPQPAAHAHPSAHGMA